MLPKFNIASIFFGTLIFAISGCGGGSKEKTDNTKSPVTLSSGKELLTLETTGLVDSNNVSSKATIEGNSITLFIPPHHDKETYNLTFTISNNASLSINGQNITSPANDITLENTTEIVVTAENNSTKTYTLAITKGISNIDSEMLTFMTEHNIPGGVLGIVKDERLVYLRALGQATDTTETKVNTLFRIASISKPITLVTILKMVEAGDLSLDQTVFGPNGVLSTQYGQGEYSTFEQMITIEHLLNHTAGWQNTPNDPMFLDSSLSQDDIINLVLTDRDPVTEPGSNYFYSNFSYLLLGKIIEKVSGMSYSDYVNTQILNPISINDMLIAGNTAAQRLPNEAQYYSLEAVNPYQLNVSRMAAHGGWIGSTSSLAKFLVHNDRNSIKEDILSSSYNSFGYLGFENWYHTGSLSGSSAYISRINNNSGFVVLFNARSTNDSFWNELNNLASELINQETLPNYDLFNN